LLEKDDVQEVLTALLDGRVGSHYSDDRLSQIFKEGLDRYAKLKPPGYKDAKSKEGDKAFGDLVLWFQVIDKAATEKVPIIIVTDDVKEDWWWRHEGKIIGPNPDLVEEIRSKADVPFYMYVPDKFMEYASGYLKQQVDQGAIDEIRELRKQDELRRIEVERYLTIQEHKLDEFRRERHMLDSEFEQLRSEISSINLQIQDIVGPEEGRNSPSTERLVHNLLQRRNEMAQRASLLEDRLSYLDREFDLEKRRRNSLVHSSLGDLRFQRKRHGAIPVVSPESIESEASLRETVDAKKPNKKDEGQP
jgi:hypothetical protein